MENPQELKLFRRETKKYLANLAKQMLEERGERSTFPQMNPVVRRYAQDIDEGLYDDPAKFRDAVDDFQGEFLRDMFPEEFAEMERKAIAAEREKEMQRGPRPFMEEIVAPNSVRVREEMKAGGRTSLI